MRFRNFAIMNFLLLVTSPAFSAGERCPSISDSKERLACFDREIKPTLPVKQKPAASKASEKTGKYVDQMQAENDRVTRRLKGICRGC